ncbi:glycosyltransferase family 1 protein [Chromobacterium sp. Panama]|uniref:glycosyltransferase family 4 protein n=1 Tax=Chromobacterium sp. Panama TaxID=2161826 RepID=UPI000D2FD2CE|nr:glycosyltransferase family 1 protein [Chromobacterium sp. Panama]PTU66616.1 glycosyltransferase family 1 protein [Chromobacterium sp. Panama]
MKILINAFSAKLGGGQTYIKNLLNNIPSRDDLEIYIYCPDGLVLPESKKLKKLSTSWPTNNPFTRSIWERFILPYIIKKYEIDILFCPGGVVNTKPPLGCKVVTMFRNMMPFDDELISTMKWDHHRLKLVLLKKAMLNSMSKADLTIFISNFARDHIEKYIKIPNGVTIPHGINKDFLLQKNPLNRPKEAPQKKYILYVSRFEIYKHHREVVAAYVSLPLGLRSQYPLVLVGETNMPEAEFIKELIKRENLQNDILLTGGVDYKNIPAWNQNAHVILFASSCENCPNILLESLASGRPVVSSNIMPMPEFGGDEILYFSPHSPDSLREKLEEILSDNTLLENVAKSSYERSSAYRWSGTAEQTWNNIFDLAEAN